MTAPRWNGENVDCFHSGFCWSTMQIPIRTVLQVANLHGLAWPAASMLPWASSYFGLLCDVCSCFFLLCPFLGFWVMVGDGGWWCWRWARQRLGRVMVLFAKACWWSPEIQKTIENLEWNQKAKHSKLPKGCCGLLRGFHCRLGCHVSSVETFRMPFRWHAPCLGCLCWRWGAQNMKGVKVMRWCSWHRFYMILYGFIIINYYYYYYYYYALLLLDAFGVFHSLLNQPETHYKFLIFFS